MDSGFLNRVEDVLHARRPSYFLADPIVRFTEVVIEPYRPQLEEGQAQQVWKQAADSYGSQISGPHFEQVTRSWTATYAGDRWGADIGEVGTSTVNDPGGRAVHEIDVVALARGDRRSNPAAREVVLGESKSSNTLRTLSDLRRLERIRALLVARGVDTASATLVIFSRKGFNAALTGEATRREDVQLVDLPTLYGG